MKIVAIKTHKITKKDHDLLAILDQYLPEKLPEESIIAVTSKIVSICEGRVVLVSDADKDELVRKEADLYLPKEENKYGVFLTIKDSLLVATAGIDESNGAGYYVLWPENAQLTANKVREYLKKRFSLEKVGVIITDSKTTPLRWGTSGVAIAHSGFAALKNYIGTPDIFGKDFQMTKASISDALAASAVVVMGEGREQTPLAVISDVPFVQFRDRNPTVEELSELKISIDDDLYAPLLKSAHWKKGKK